MKIVIDIPDHIYDHAKSISEDSNDEYEAMRAIEKGTDLIYCKDCAFYQAPVKYSYKETTLYCCRSAITKVSEDDYCSKAVRRLKEG